MRNFDDWIERYIEHASIPSEAPEHFHFWIGVSLVAAVLGRRVWWGNGAHRLFPNFYLMLVGPPAVVKKTTTMAQGVEILRGLEDFHLGPSTITWQSLVKELKEAEVAEEIGEDEWEEQSNMFIASGEMGTFVDPQERGCMDMLVKMWDGEEIDKITMKDRFNIKKPLLSFITCTTPDWIRASIPDYMIQGGLLSRIVAIYGDKRSKRVADPDLVKPANHYVIQQKLVDDLEAIRTIRGDVYASEEAVAYRTEQYERLCDEEENEDYRGILRRKQVQILKLAMVLAASRGEVYKKHIRITPEVLEEAERRINEIQEQRLRIFKYVGKGRQAVIVGYIVEMLQKKGPMRTRDLYKEVFNDVPNKDEFSSILLSAYEARVIKMHTKEGGAIWVEVWKEE